MKKPWTLFRAGLWGLQGLGAAWKRGMAFRVAVVVGGIAIVVAFCLPISGVERSLLVGVIFVVWITETINSALESVVDRVGKEPHPLSGAAKDMAAAAVLLSVILALYVWIEVLLSVFWDIFVWSG